MHNVILVGNHSSPGKYNLCRPILSQGKPKIQHLPSIQPSYTKHFQDLTIRTSQNTLKVSVALIIKLWLKCIGYTVHSSTSIQYSTSYLPLVEGLETSWDMTGPCTAATQETQWYWWGYSYTNKTHPVCSLLCTCCKLNQHSLLPPWQQLWRATLLLASEITRSLVPCPYFSLRARNATHWRTNKSVKNFSRVRSPSVALRSRKIRRWGRGYVNNLRAWMKTLHGDLLSTNNTFSPVQTQLKSTVHAGLWLQAPVSSAFTFVVTNQMTLPAWSDLAVDEQHLFACTHVESLRQSLYGFTEPFLYTCVSMLSVFISVVKLTLPSSFSSWARYFQWCCTMNLIITRILV